MKIHFLPKGVYKIGQRININGVVMAIETHTTYRNVMATTLPSASRFERVLIILTDEPAIEEQTK